MVDILSKRLYKSEISDMTTVLFETKRRMYYLKKVKTSINVVKRVDFNFQLQLSTFGKNKLSFNHYFGGFLFTTKSV